MNNNYHIIYVTNSGYRWFYDHIIKILIPDKVYFYYLFVNRIINFYRYVPLRPYMNNTGFKL